MQSYSVYVYYKVNQSEMSQCIRDSFAFGKELRNEFTEVRFSLSRRPEVRNGEITIMESFALGEVAPEFVEHFLSKLSKLACGNSFEHFQVQRHTEVFLDILTP